MEEIMISADKNECTEEEWEDFINSYDFITEDRPYITDKDIALIITSGLRISDDVFDVIYSGSTNYYSCEGDFLISTGRHGWAEYIRVVVINNKPYGIVFNYHDDYGTDFNGDPAREARKVLKVSYRIKEDK